jgi:rubredoxin
MFGLGRERMGDSRFCPQCGTPRTGALSFCRNCGYNYDAETPMAPAPVRLPAIESEPAASGLIGATSVAAVPAAKPRWYRTKVGMGGIAVGTIFVLGAIGSIGRPSTEPAAATLAPSARATLVAAATAGAASTAVTSTGKPSATPVPKPTAKPTPVPTPRPVTYAKLTSRQWAKIVKDPDAYTGKTYQVWGCIWQFDAATGTDSFLAYASFQKEPYWYLDGENASFTADLINLSDFVEDDVVVMNVTVDGSYSYDTQAGGNTTVPSFFIEKISHKGSCA